MKKKKLEWICCNTLISLLVLRKPNQTLSRVQICLCSSKSLQQVLPRCFLSPLGPSSFSNPTALYPSEPAVRTCCGWSKPDTQTHWPPRGFDLWVITDLTASATTRGTWHRQRLGCGKASGWAWGQTMTGCEGLWCRDVKLSVTVATWLFSLSLHIDLEGFVSVQEQLLCVFKSTNGNCANFKPQSQAA